MVIAADYPFLDIFWTMLIFFLWVIWFWILIRVIADIFRRHDISGWGKAGWTLFVIVLPFLGVFIYLIANGDEMGKRDVEQAQASQAQFDEHVRSVPVAAARPPRSRRPSSCSTAEPSRRPSSRRSRRRRSPSDPPRRRRAPAGAAAERDRPRSALLRAGRGSRTRGRGDRAARREIAGTPFRSRHSGKGRR